MPHKEDGDGRLVIEQLHPTFAAEVRGVDFSQDIPPELFDEIHEAITKVSPTLSHHKTQQHNRPLRGNAPS